MPSLEVSVARVESRSTLLVGRGLIASIASILSVEKHSTIAVVADSGAHVTTSALQKVLSLKDSQILTISGGEGQKSPDGLLTLWSFFHERQLDRRSLVICVGGGASSDLVGFAAATYMRGIATANIPTTLLAQVDASIGGKSGINFKGVKNLIGSISQPKAVIIDIDSLATLPPRELRSGYAEIIKHGLIQDAEYFAKASSRPCESWSPDELVDLVFRSCEIKKCVVEADESEQGLRKTLNFGHSIGHAIESLSMRKGPTLTHGEAISIGMYGESFISYRLGKISEHELAIIERGLSGAGLPIRLSEPLSIQEIREALGRDKKNVGGAVKWTLLEKIGLAMFDVEIPEALITEALKRIQP